MALRRLLRKPLPDREHEGSGFAGTSLRGGEQVAALQHDGDRLRLDRRGGGVAFVRDGTQQAVGEAEILERHRNMLLNAPGPASQVTGSGSEIGLFEKPGVRTGPHPRGRALYASTAGYGRMLVPFVYAGADQ